MQKVEIKAKKEKPFVSNEGEQINYYWYTAILKGGTKDGVTIQFGSPKGTYEKGDIIEINLERVEFANGKLGYKEAGEEE